MLPWIYGWPRQPLVWSTNALCRNAWGTQLIWCLISLYVKHWYLSMLICIAMEENNHIKALSQHHICNSMYLYPAAPKNSSWLEPATSGTGGGPADEEAKNPQALAPVASASLKVSWSEVYSLHGFRHIFIPPNSTYSLSALVQLGGLWGAVPHSNFPDAACQSKRESFTVTGYKKIRKINSLIILGRKANDQGSYYEDHVTQISRAQAGGLLS